MLHSDITEKVRAENEARQAGERGRETAPSGAGGVAANQAKSGISGDDEPRDPHADECRDRAVVGCSNSDLDGEQRHVADAIHNSSDNLLRLLNDILDLSKLDAGKFDFEAAAVLAGAPSSTLPGQHL